MPSVEFRIGEQKRCPQKAHNPSFPTMPHVARSFDYLQSNDEVNENVDINCRKGTVLVEALSPLLSLFSFLLFRWGLCVAVEAKLSTK